MTQEDLGSKTTYIHWQNWTEGVGHHFASKDPLVLPNLVIRMLFPVLVTWTLCIFCLFMSFLICMLFGALALAPLAVVKIFCADMLANDLYRLHMMANL